MYHKSIKIFRNSQWCVYRPRHSGRIALKKCLNSTAGRMGNANHTIPSSGRIRPPWQNLKFAQRSYMTAVAVNLLTLFCFNFL